ncbi:MAG: hypothetical protein ACREK9_03870 [Candidatus Rokuibacteriota bacterium]
MILVVWVLAGPVAMAFDGCSAMGAMCEGPCGMIACPIAAPPVAVAPKVVYAVVAGAVQSVPEVIARALDLPPKSASLLS